MSSHNSFSEIPLSERPKDFLRIYKSRGKVKLGVGIFTFKDKDTKQIVRYVPTLELSGYGDTYEEASEMIKFAIDDFCRHILTLSLPKIQSELVGLGWKQDKYSHKEFSNVFIDGEGKLNNFNAEEDSVIEARLEYA